MATIISVLETADRLRWKLIYLSWYGITAHTDKTRNGKVQEVIVRWEDGNLMMRSDNTATDLFGRKKNRANVTDFLSAFHTVRQHVTEWERPRSGICNNLCWSLAKVPRFDLLHHHVSAPTHAPLSVITAVRQTAHGKSCSYYLPGQSKCHSQSLPC